MEKDRLDLLDYYTLLQVADAATADQIRDAFHSFALKFHPDRHAGSTEDKVSRAEEIYRRGAEAYKAPGDPEIPRRYEAQLQKGKLRFDPEDEGGVSRTTRSGSQRVQVRSPKARPFAGKAEHAIRREDWKTAELNLKIAMQHEPDNALLEARLAFVEDKMNKR